MGEVCADRDNVLTALCALALARSRGWRAFVADAAVWRFKHAALRLEPPLREDAPTNEALRALSRALDRACATPASELAITWMNNPQYWCLAREDARAAVAGAICPEGAALCRAVCWFDVNGIATLGPGTWLLRLRVKAMYALHESIQLQASTESSGVRLTQLPGAGLACRAPPSSASWGVEQPRNSCTPFAYMYKVMKLGRWSYLPAAVVHVPAGTASAVVEVRFWRHSMQWYSGIIIDCMQAVPLHDATRWPLPFAGVAATEEEAGHAYRQAHCVHNIDAGDEE